jgi:hypothetical protein
MTWFSSSPPTQDDL